MSRLYLTRNIHRKIGEKKNKMQKENGKEMQKQIVTTLQKLVFKCPVLDKHKNLSWHRKSH